MIITRKKFFFAILFTFLTGALISALLGVSFRHLPLSLNESKKTTNSSVTLKESQVSLGTAEKSPQQNTTPTVSGEEIMAWIYPGDPACHAAEEYTDGRRIDVLKPEYFRVEQDGTLQLLTDEKDGCNGFSEKNIAEIKKYSQRQYVTISSSYSKSMDAFLQKSLENDENVRTLVDFVDKNDLTGVEIDFEDFGGWDKTVYGRYKEFVSKLGDALHQEGKLLMIDGPAFSGAEQEGWFVWRYEDFNALHVDQIVVMAYDYQFDYGVGSPVTPLDWLKQVIAWTRKHVPEKKITIGIPSYGYKGLLADRQKVTILTYDQIKNEPGFETATREGTSAELSWRNQENVYFFQDSQSLDAKRKLVRENGISSVSVWHLGGNMWFSNGN